MKDFLERKQHSCVSEEKECPTAEKKHLMFAEKRHDTLQTAVQLCDFSVLVQARFTDDQTHR
jgi:hypothetical protein